MTQNESEKPQKAQKQILHFFFQKKIFLPMYQEMIEKRTKMSRKRHNTAKMVKNAIFNAFFQGSPSTTVVTRNLFRLERILPNK